MCVQINCGCLVPVQIFPLRSFDRGYTMHQSTLNCGRHSTLYCTVHVLHLLLLLNSMLRLRTAHQQTTESYWIILNQLLVSHAIEKNERNADTSSTMWCDDSLLELCICFVLFCLSASTLNIFYRLLCSISAVMFSCCYCCCRFFFAAPQQFLFALQMINKRRIKHPCNWFTRAVLAIVCSISLLFPLFLCFRLYLLKMHIGFAPLCSVLFFHSSFLSFICNYLREERTIAAHIGTQHVSTLYVCSVHCAQSLHCLVIAIIFAVQLA